MKYVTQIVVDKAIVANRQLFGFYEWHQEAWRLFPGRPRDKRDFLTRLDVDEHEFRFTVLSAVKAQKPDWCAREWWNEKEMPQSFFEQKRYLFKVMANPTKTLSRRDPAGKKKKHGSHYAITRLDELKTWIINKGKQYGFFILEEPKLEISPRCFTGFTRKIRNYKKNTKAVLLA